MKIAVVSPQVPKNIKQLINLDNYLVYACDSAVKELLNQKITIDLAIGDFDSLENLDLLEDIKTIKLNKEKDFSDTSYALKHAYNHSDDVILIGGVKGSRADHLIANILLLEKYKNLVIIDDTNKIFKLENGKYVIDKSRYDYVSIFPLENSVITLEGFKYNLNKESLKANDPLGLSNEIVYNKAVIEVHKGVLLVIQSK